MLIIPTIHLSSDVCLIFEQALHLLCKVTQYVLTQLHLTRRCSVRGAMLCTWKPAAEQLRDTKAICWAEAQMRTCRPASLAVTARALCRMLYRTREWTW